jgi:hypothetical protein
MSVLFGAAALAPTPGELFIASVHYLMLKSAQLRSLLGNLAQLA